MPRAAGSVRHPDLLGVAANAAITGFGRAWTRAKMFELKQRGVRGFYLLDTGAVVSDREGSYALARTLIRAGRRPR